MGPDQATCKYCDSPLDPRRVKLGYTTCLDCSSRMTMKYVGRRQGKHGDIEVYRTNQSYWLRHLRRENAVGFNANLPVSNPVVESKKEGGDIE